MKIYRIDLDVMHKGYLILAIRDTYFNKNKNLSLIEAINYSGKLEECSIEKLIEIATREHSKEIVISTGNKKHQQIIASIDGYY